MKSSSVSFGGLYLIEQWLAEHRSGRILQIMGMESLFLYLSHLMIVYGNGPRIMNMLFGFDHTGYAGVAAIWIFVTVPLVAIAIGWQRLKKEHQLVARWILVIQVSWIALSFILTPPGFAWTQLLE